MPTFGKKSNDELNTTHPDMQLIHKTAIKNIHVDYGIHQGGRSFEQQLEYFLNKKSKLDPRIPSKLLSAKHVIKEGLRDKAEATDIHISEKYKDENLAWNKDHLIYVAGYLMATADMLFSQGKITHKLRWGGNWSMDGVILLDQEFDDLPHFELYKP